MYRKTQTVLLLFIFFFLCGCSVNSVKPASPPTIIPDTVSSQIKKFIWQEDGLYAYAMLRPADWLSVENSNRTYYPPDVTDPADFSIIAMNLHTFADSGMDQLYIEPWELYKQNPGLKSWTRSLEQTWQENGEANHIALVESGDNFRVYAFFPSEGYLRLTAYIVDQDQPILVVLDTTGDLANLTILKESGILADYLTMVSSARAIPFQPFRVSPSLNK